MSEGKDKLVYFKLRARAEPIRMLYSVSGTDYENDTSCQGNWEKVKPTTPTGQVPILCTKEGTLNQSNVIFRYAAKKTGMYGKGLWEEAQHDLVIENVKEVVDEMPKIYKWLVFGAPEPENKQGLCDEIKSKWEKCLKYMEQIHQKNGKKFIVHDQIGAADIWLYTALEFAQKGFPDIMSLTPWTKKFTENFKSDEKVKKYLTERPESSNGL